MTWKAALKVVFLCLNGRLTLPDYIIPFKHAVKDIYQLAVSSQQLFHAELPVRPKISGNAYVLEEKDLSLFVDSAEWNIGNYL